MRVLIENKKQKKTTTNRQDWNFLSKQTTFFWLFE